MDKKLATVLGAVGTLACAGAAQAMTPATPAVTGAAPVQSYTDLLQPVPNATEVLAQMNASEDAAPAARIENVQWHHHHHHHHHHFVRRYRVFPPRIIMRHHHHHHHHHFRRGW